MIATIQTTDQSHRQEFLTQGYTIARNFFSEQEMTDLIQQIESPESGECLDQVLSKGTLRFYANLFRQNSSIREFVSQPKLVDFLKPVIGPDFWVRWDQAVAKGPGAKTFPWHQDNAYNGFKHTHYQLWVALTEMTPENGGLWLVPGSHKRLLPHERVDCHMVYKGKPESPLFIEANKGDLVLFSSLTLHRTTPNTTAAIRWAYVIEYMSIDDIDPGIKPPYFIVAKKGQPQAEFVQSYRGLRNPLNHLKYRLSRREVSKLLWE
ncbi:MAG: phytanoyl-CoA dioxygenase family protein [Acaryochloridaceae cyanobacterium SU_2_1]|nr:phytanoyl-CoA dioxygenase family protein [Acaryochloridaceae cyanobacterium SU_2_1]